MAIHHCNNKKCTSNFQDTTYGVSMRVHNDTAKKPSNKGGVRCTVCGTISEKKV